MRKFIIVCLFALFSSVASAQTGGYEFSAEATGAIGLSKYSKYNVGASIINGYRFNDRFAIGLGIGFRYAETLYYFSEDSKLGNYESRDNKFLLPIFLRAKFDFIEGKIAPFIIGDIGYTIDVGQNQYKNLDALFVEPIIGVDFKTGKSTWFLGLGVNVQQHHYQYFHISSVTMSSERRVNDVAPTLALHFGVQF